MKCFYSFGYDVFSNEMNKLSLVMHRPLNYFSFWKTSFQRQRVFQCYIFCSFSSCHSFYTVVIITVKYKVDIMHCEMSHHISTTTASVIMCLFETSVFFNSGFCLFNRISPFSSKSDVGSDNSYFRTSSIFILDVLMRQIMRV